MLYFYYIRVIALLTRKIQVMKTLRLCITIAALISSTFNPVNAQQQQRCHTDEYGTVVERYNPAIVAQKQSVEKQYVQFIQSYTAQNDATRRSSAGAKYVIPVVVHIIHHPSALNIGDSSNILNEAVYDQIRILNEDYRRIPGTMGDGPGKDVQIEFQLANKDPDGNCHTGIIRIGDMQGVALDDLDTTENKKLKKLSHWPANRYLNLYVIHSFKDPVYGFASFPWHTGTPYFDSTDGVTIVYSAFGLTTDPYANIGRTATHEVGHWLGLEHTFNGGCKNDSCLVNGDKVCDTPPAKTSTKLTHPCSVSYDSCATDVDDTTINNPFRSVALGGLGNQNVQHENYMDYSKDSCMDRFTNGQYARMKFYIANQRASVVASSNLVLTGNKGLLHDFDSVGAVAGFDRKVTAMVEWNGKLVIGGQFTKVGNMPCPGIVTWDGTKFDTLAGAPTFDHLSNNLTCMAVYKGDLYIGGSFIFYTLARYLIKYDGVTWSKVTTNADIQATGGTVSALQVYKGKLYVGGGFGQVNGGTVNVNRIATWDGTAWGTLGSGTTNGVTGSSSACYAMTLWDDKLIVGGRFSKANTTTCDKIAAWDGSTFYSLDTDTNDVNSGSVNALSSYDGKLFAGGNFYSVGGNLITGLSVYDSSSWKEAASGGVGSSDLFCMEPFNGYLWVGGSIQDISNNVYGAYTYDVATDSFRTISPNHSGIDGTVNSMAVYKDRLYIGGEFPKLMGKTAPYSTVHENFVSVKLICPDPPPSLVRSNMFQETSMKLYPNPATRTIIVENAKADITVYNVLGAKVITASNQGKSKTELDIASLTTGVYLLKSGNEVLRFVKQ